MAAFNNNQPHQIKEVQPVYSPRIREALIPRVYRAARVSGIPMTAWVNRAIEEALQEQERIESEVADASVEQETTTSREKELNDGIGRIPQTD